MLRGKKKPEGVEDSENDRTVVPGGLCARQSDLKMEGGVCVYGRKGLRGCWTLRF